MMERESSSSDEEEDHHHLIEQNDRPATMPCPRSSFHIDDLKSRFSVCRRLSLNKRYLLAIFLPLVIVVVYFSTDIKNLFQTGVSSVKFDASVDRMRESELRALYLLRQQQLGLLKLWNHTLISQSLNFSLNPLNSTYPPLHDPPRLQPSSSLEDLKSTVFNQISLNKQIQEVLLSSHQSRNSLDLTDNINNTDLTLNGFAYLSRCRKFDNELLERRTIEWKPKPNKYLFAICVSGQMSNHMICLDKHMFFAAVMNRILIIPSSKVDYDFRRVLDLENINKCLGRKVVATFEEFVESRKNHLHIDKFICYFSLPQPCFLDEERIKKLKSLGISMNKLQSAWTEDVKNPKKKTLQEVVAKFSSDDDVVAIGDVFFADVEKDWVMQPGGPISHNCKTLIEPSRLIMLTAQRFVQTFLGDDFIALHFRRHGFLKFCNAKKPSCFFSVPQAATCINRVLERANTPVIYLSTDAAESETALLQSLVVLHGRSAPLVKRPARNSAEKWDALLYRHGLEDNQQVEAMLDKAICALSSVFIGSAGSTFTEDILRLRKDWGSASLCDEYICQGEVPNFVAVDE